MKGVSVIVKLVNQNFCPEGIMQIPQDRFVGKLVSAMVWFTLISVMGHGVQTNVYYANVANVGQSAPPYTSWATAATNLQDAIDAADAAFVDGETIGLVRVAAGHYLLNETLSITNNPVILVNDAGRDETLIDGQGSIQSMYINADALFEGFTVTNGYRDGTLYGGNIQLIRGTVRNCRITGGWVSGFGGGIAIQGTSAKLEKSLVTGNRGGQGGGVVMTSGWIVDCVISNNTSESYFQRGGGIRMSGGTVERCLIADNRGGVGAGIRLYNGTVRNCLIMNNRADIDPYNGGGVYQDNGLLQNCTVVGNHANLTGGGVVLGGTYARVRNSIVYYNSATTSDNLHRTGSWFEYSNTFPDSPEDDKASGNTPLPPQFVDFEAGDYRLLPGSSCIDTGSATGAPADDYVQASRPTDGDGDGSDAYDMGAFEAPEFTNAPLRCNVVGFPLVGFAPLSVDFSAYVAGPDTNGMQYAWNFGDGKTLAFSPQREVTHVYDFGAFDVTLTVSNAAGQVTNIVKTAYVEVASDTVYVSPNGSHVAPFGSWATAATNLQDAVDAALDTPEFKSSVLVGDGTYRLNEPLTLEKNITIESVNGATATILDGGGEGNAYRAVFIGATDAVFRGFTVSNAVTTDSGAGIYLQGGALRDCIVANNRTTGHGAGIFMASGTSVSNCLVTGNRVESSNRGGGVYVSGSSLLEDCEIRANELTGNGDGAGIYIASSTSVARDCWIHSNTNHYRGGGVSINSGTIEDCIVEANRAGTGGGIFSDYGKIYRNRFIHNYGSGGAAYLRTGSIFRNNLVLGNHSPNLGGGIRIQHGSGQLVENNTIVGNYAGTYGGGLYQETGAVTNAILWANAAGSGGQDFAGSITNIGYSCASDLEPDVLTGNIAQNPIFDEPGSGVGLAHVAGDYHLKVESPCANTGVYIAWMDSAVDFDNEPRIQDTGVNMGAYERLILPRGTLFLLR